jgi:DHA2 family multidrug resistance protein
VLRLLSRLEIFDRGLGAEKIGLGLCYPRAIIVILDLDQQLALLDPLKIVDQEPSSKPRPSAPRMSARPCVVSRALRVEMIAPIMTATTPTAGYSQRPIAGSGIGAAAAAPDTVMAVAVWLSTRRVLLWTGAIFTLASLPPPLVHDYNTLIGLQLVRGLAVGAFIPAALGFVLRSLAPQWRIWGIAAYTFRFVFSQNIGSAVEGWYSETGHWEWIFWQNAALTPVMMLLTAVAMPHRPVDRDLLRRTDWAGIVYAGIGFGLIYAGLDQGNRLDWLNSGVVTGLLLAGGMLVVAFIMHEARAEYPLIHLSVLARPNIAVAALLILIYPGFATTGASFVLPDYLTRVQGLRALQIGDALYWIALPQFVLVPLVALLLRRIDARLLLVFGATMLAIGSWIETGLTHDWASGDFIVSQLIEAVGLAFAITSVIAFAVANVTPALAAAIAATIQITRWLGSEIGNVVMQTFVRVREQVYSNLIGLHVVTGLPATEQATAQLAGPFGSRATGIGEPAAQGTAVLAGIVRREAYVLAYIDAFWLIAWISLLGILLVLLLRPPPPNPIIPSRGAS